MGSFWSNLVYFFTVIDPIGSIPVYLAVVYHYRNQDRIKIAVTAILVAFAVLIFFAVAGEIVFAGTETPLYAFQISGGIILFLFSLTMIFGEGKPEGEVKQVDNSHHSAVFPLAIPSIASPGAIIAAVMLTDNNRYSYAEQAMVILSIAIILAVTFVFLVFANFLYRFMGPIGASITSRVMGMILSAFAANQVLLGTQNFLQSIT